MKKRWLIIVAFLSLSLAVVLTACGGDPIKYRISVENTVGGEIVCAEEAAAGETVTITCAPDDGFAFKEGSLKVNGEAIEGNSFRMPERDVTVTGEFVLADYKGTYVYYEYDVEQNGYLFEFIEVGESTLTIGKTLATSGGNFDYKIFDPVPYEVENYVIKATVNGAAWSVQIGIAALYDGTYEYVLSANATLGGTYTEIAEQNERFIERDYTFSDGTLVMTTYFEDGKETSENATYQIFGNFLYIEEQDTVYETDRIKYGVLNVQDGSFVFLHNYRYSASSGTSHTITDTLNLYPKSEEQIALKEGGAYILTGSVNPYNDESWGTPACYDFLSIQNGKLAFSRHGVSYNGGLHYYGAETAYGRFGNVLKVSYSLDGKDFVLCFHIIDENTIFIKSTMNQVEKFDFVEDHAFEGGHGAKYSNSDSTTYEMRYYEDGKFADKVFDKQTNVLVDTRERGTYHVYGNLLVCVWDSASMGIYIGVIEGQTEETYEYDYCYRYQTVWWNNTCESGSETLELIWKSDGSDESTL